MSSGLGCLHDVGRSIQVTAAGRELCSYVYRPADDPTESPRPYVHPLRTLGGALVSGGRYDEAESLTRECEAACRANDVNSQIHWRALRAKTFARRNAFEDAERLALEAIDLAKTSDFLPAHADALAAFAEVLTLADRREEAGHLLEDAIHLYELKGDLLTARAAHDRLRHADVRT